MNIFDVYEGLNGYSCKECGKIVHFDKNMKTYPKCPTCENDTYNIY
ncbi:MAG: hypothetical protein ACK5LV_10105 [Lachnospirales bacterium]